jgi:hypothetical protein
MKKTSDADRETLWKQQNEEFRDPSEIVSYWQDANRIDPRLLEYRVTGKMVGNIRRIRYHPPHHQGV